MKTRYEIRSTHNNTTHTIYDMYDIQDGDPLDVCYTHDLKLAELICNSLNYFHEINKGS